MCLTGQLEALVEEMCGVCVWGIVITLRYGCLYGRDMFPAVDLAWWSVKFLRNPEIEVCGDPGIRFDAKVQTAPYLLSSR